MARHRRPQPPATRQVLPEPVTPVHVQRADAGRHPGTRAGATVSATGSAHPTATGSARRPDPPGGHVSRARRRRARVHELRVAALPWLLLPTVTAVTVAAMTIGVAFAVTGTSPSASRTDRASSGARFAPADLSEPPTAFDASPAEAAAIAEAVRTSALTAGVPGSHYEVVNTRIAASDPSWAWTELQPVVADLDRVEGVLHQVDGRWELVQLGSFEVGCDVAPRQVMEDLELYCGAWDAPVSPGYTA